MVLGSYRIRELLLPKEIVDFELISRRWLEGCQLGLAGVVVSYLLVLCVCACIACVSVSVCVCVCVCVCAEVVNICVWLIAMECIWLPNQTAELNSDKLVQGCTHEHLQNPEELSHATSNSTCPPAGCDFTPYLHTSWTPQCRGKHLRVERGGGVTGCFDKFF